MRDGSGLGDKRVVANGPGAQRRERARQLTLTATDIDDAHPLHRANRGQEGIEVRLCAKIVDGRFSQTHCHDSFAPIVVKVRLA
jgi:hypothetical protein